MAEIEQRLKEADGPQDDLDASRWRASIAEKLFGKGQAEVRIGRHRVVERIGEGASGVVYLAVDPELDRRVALKVLRRDALSPSGDPQAWLAREAKTLAKLSHPNVVPVYDVGKHDGKVFITLEYVEGSNLRQWLAQTHEVAEIVDVLGQAGRGLAAAHGAGVVHRDFKPENVLLGDDGRVRVSDFGIARRLDTTQQEPTLPEGADAIPSHAGETTTYRGAGTPAYMAPEQFLGDPVDERTDQFSFCVVLHEALYGRRPFLGGDRAKLAANVIAGRRIIPPGAEPPPRWLERVVARGLAVRPEDRYPSMGALLAELSRDRKRRLWPPLAAGALGVGATAAVLVTSPGELPDPCAGGRDKVGAIWNDSAAARVQAAFSETALPYADDSWQRVDTEIRTYADQWVTAHDQACEQDATQEVVVERLHCLQSRLLELGSLTDLYARADTQVVEHAVRAVGSLRKPSECLLVQATGVEASLPGAKAEVRLAVAQAKANGDLGRPKEAARQAWEAARSAQALGDRALEAEALIVAGVSEHFLLAESDKARPDSTTYAAVLAAEAARRPDLLARAYTAYFESLVQVGEYGRAFEWEPRARSAVEAMGSPPELVGRLEFYLALAHESRDSMEEARDATKRARAALQDGGAGTRKFLGKALNLEGEWHFYAKKYDGALKAYQRSLAVLVQELGPRHTWSANGHGNMAEVFFVTGDYDRALTHFETALAIRREAFGNEAIWVPHTLAHIGDVQLARGETEAALQAYGEGLKLRRGAGLVHDRQGPQPAVFRDLQAELQETWLRRGLALALLEVGRFEEALEHAKAVADTELPRDRQHADLTGRLDVVGQVLLAMGDHEAAERELESALSRMEEHYGRGHRFLAWPLTALAQAKLARGNPQAAAELAGRAIAIRDFTPRANLRSRAQAEKTLANALSLMQPEIQPAR